MDRKEQEMYSEVHSILAILDKGMVSKLPKKLLDIIEKNRLESYNPKYTLSKSLLEQDVKRETIAFITLLQMNYWCDSEEEKNQIKQILRINSEKMHQTMREKYSSENMFKQINEARNKMNK